MGAKDGFLVESEDFSRPDGEGRPAHDFLKKESVSFDAIFTGVQSEDDQFASVGGILAAKLGLPYASMVIGIDAFERAGRRYAGSWKAAFRSASSLRCRASSAYRAASTSRATCRSWASGRRRRSRGRSSRQAHIGGRGSMIDLSGGSTRAKKGGAVMLRGA